MFANSTPLSFCNASKTEAPKKREPTKTHFIETLLKRQDGLCFLVRKSAVRQRSADAHFEAPQDHRI
jgi:hypothetical protein